MSGLREEELEVISAMFLEHELIFPDADDRYTFVLKLVLDDDDNTGIELHISLPPEYPILEASISVRCDTLSRTEHAKFMNELLSHLENLDQDEMRSIAAVDWIKDNGAQFLTAAPVVVEKVEEQEDKPIKGFMREWCSFVSFYKDSYISGPNRFEVMTSLAKQRGLNITGMGISGKPGGLVCEGEEGDVEEFMNLMRTDFFETLNPRGRKLTTRLQERWPLDKEVDRYEAAVIEHKLRTDAYRSEDRSGGKVKFKPGEADRLEKQEKEDKEILANWKHATGKTLSSDEISKLVDAGHPSKCTTPGVYAGCGCEEPPSLEEINRQRLFKDFTIFGTGYEGCYTEAAKVFKDIDAMHGFHAMFDYRFS
mmetsp:Transcript_56703/g.124316  ORF Transcript_56703/g.124316 Transcript_56703/m.124316 type:complete len:367 (+) Transcript_56703:17-1117(+)